MSFFGIYKDDEIIVPAAITEDIFHYAVHEGLAFTTGNAQTLASGNKIIISLKTPASTTYLHFLYKAQSSLEANFSIREACTMNTGVGADALRPAPNRRRLGTPPVTTVLGHETDSWVAGAATVDGTVNAAGTIINGGGGGEHIGGGRVGGSVSASHEFVLKPDTIYAFELTSEAAANDCYLELNWFEVPQA